MSGRNKDRGIPLHPKYGLNPTLEVCFWCGEDTGSILLLGRSIKGEAPMRMMGSYAPCEKCAEKWNLGFVFIEADNKPIVEGQPPISEGVWPTGNYAVINQEAAERIMGKEKTEAGAGYISRKQFADLTRKTAEELPNDNA